eukprot:886612-Prorocentrum_minimum.AAC.1
MILLAAFFPEICPVTYNCIHVPRDGPLRRDGPQEGYVQRKEVCPPRHHSWGGQAGIGKMHGPMKG